MKCGTSILHFTPNKISVPHVKSLVSKIKTSVFEGVIYENTNILCNEDFCRWD